VRLPPLDVIIELHGETIELHGGLPGIKNRGNLEASLARAEHLLAYADPPPDAVDLACAICVSINRNHAFNDGNKRIAFITLALTLELNGYSLDVRERDAVKVMMAQAAGELSETEFVRWVRANIEVID